MTTMDLDLDAIRARHAAFEVAWDHEFCGPDGPACAARSAEGVPALLAVAARLAAVEATYTELLRRANGNEDGKVTLADLSIMFDALYPKWSAPLSEGVTR